MKRTAQFIILGAALLVSWCCSSLPVPPGRYQTATSVDEQPPQIVTTYCGYGWDW